uniref:Hydroxysteroid (17-beta) dehydrogenase 1 n=1 Tax=Sinocyclocheilus rhinocerous TaxID=307959 RepID=A0A673JIN5_9TELE
IEQKVVLITGCSSGIGLSLVVHLASDPSKAYKVYATMRNLCKKQRLLESVRGLHKDTMAILQMDVTEQQIDILGKRKKDILAFQREKVCINSTHWKLHGMLDVNLLCTLRTIQTFLPDMKRKRHARILVTGSIGGLQGYKFAVEGACESLAILLQHFNIHVSLIEFDAHTHSLYDQYLQHCQSVFHQDTDDITQVLPPTQFLRYYTNRALLPMSSLKLTSMNGSQYIRAMSKLIFSAPNTDPQI